MTARFGFGAAYWRGSVGGPVWCAVFCACAACLALWGCYGNHLGMWSAKSEIVITVAIAPDANANTAVPVDFIMVYSDEVGGQLAGLSARTWNQKKAQFFRDFTKGTDYDIVHREYVPGTTVPDVTVPTKLRSTMLIIFADYLTEGEHRFISKTAADLHCVFQRKGFVVQPVKTTAHEAQ